MIKYIKKDKISGELKKLNLIKNFSLNKKYSKLIGLKMYRLLLILRLFNVMFPLLNLKIKLKSNIRYKMDLILFGFDNIIFGIKFLLKYYVNKNLIILIKPLKNLIKIIKLRKSKFLKRYSLYIKNDKKGVGQYVRKYFDIGLNLDLNYTKKRRITNINIIKLLKMRKKENNNIDFSLLKKNKKKFNKKHINFLKKLIVQQNPVRSKIKDMRILLLKLYQYVGQRKGFVYKKKIKNYVLSNFKFKYYIKNILSKLFFVKVKYNRRLFLVRRYDLGLKKYNFINFVKT
jgi:hypothetical protein